MQQIHGTDNNPVYELAHLYNVSYVPDDGESYIARNERGEDVTDVLDEAYETFEEALEHRDNRTEVSYVIWKIV